MTTVSHTIQDGTGQAGHTVAGVWTESGFFVMALNGSQAGFVFDLQYTLESTRSLPVDPPIFGNTFSFDLGTAAGAITDTPVLKVYFVNEVQPDNYSDSALPGSRANEKLIGVLYPAANDELIVPFGESDGTDTLGVSSTVADNLKTLRGNVLASSQFRGRLALSLVISGGSGLQAFNVYPNTTGFDPPSLSCDESSFHTGFSDWPVGRGRAVHCGRTGFPAVADDLIEDGWFPGLFVQPRAWEDEDRQGEAEMPDTEGDIDDEVTT